jgi:acyl-ACP thioesterase
MRRNFAIFVIYVIWKNEMDNPASYYKNFNVNSYETDSTQHLMLYHFFQWCTEIAWEHVKILKLGFEQMSDEDNFWVLLGMKVKIKRYPKWQDKVQMETYPSNIGTLYFNREFILRDDKEVLAMADSKWIIFNRTTNRPHIPFTPDYVLHSVVPKNVIFNKLKAFQNLPQQEKVNVHYSDIDMHQHTNNAVYVRWLEDCINANTSADQQPRRISEISIQFINEAKIADEVVINFDKDKQRFEALFADGRQCFRAELSF